MKSLQEKLHASEVDFSEHCYWAGWILRCRGGAYTIKTDVGAVVFEVQSFREFNWRDSGNHAVSYAITGAHGEGFIRNLAQVHGVRCFEASSVIPITEPLVHGSAVNIPRRRKLQRSQFLSGNFSVANHNFPGGLERFFTAWFARAGGVGGIQARSGLGPVSVCPQPIFTPSYSGAECAGVLCSISDSERHHPYAHRGLQAVGRCQFGEENGRVPTKNPSRYFEAHHSYRHGSDRRRANPTDSTQSPPLLSACSFWDLTSENLKCNEWCWESPEGE